MTFDLTEDDYAGLLNVLGDTAAAALEAGDRERVSYILTLANRISKDSPRLGPFVVVRRRDDRAGRDTEGHPREPRDRGEAKEDAQGGATEKQ